MENTTVFLTPLDAKKFLLFQKYYAVFDSLDKNGVFNMQFGKATLNFAHGELQNVIKEEMIFKR
jgi:hypothetical protein